MWFLKTPYSKQPPVVVAESVVLKLLRTDSITPIMATHDCPIINFQAMYHSRGRMTSTVHLTHIICSCCCFFISHELIHYESSRGYKIDGIKPNQTGTRSEESRESRQEVVDKKVASKGHRRHAGRDTREAKINLEIKMNQQETQTQAKAQTEVRYKRQLHNMLLSRLRKKGSPISGGIQSRHEDKGKDSGCDTQRMKNTEGGKGDTPPDVWILRDGSCSGWGCRARRAGGKAWYLRWCW